MSPRHTAALALVAWYFMTPPLTRQLKNNSLQVNASFSKWAILETFSSEADCRKREKIYRAERGRGEVGEITLEERESRNGRCVAGNDPGLKEKWR
jgi:hypothetical protein